MARPGIVDAQVHVWGANSPERPWPPGRDHLAQKPYPVTKELILEGMDEAGWRAIRPNLTTVAEAGEWWRLVTGPIDSCEFSEEDRAYLTEAAATLTWGDDP